ncbi:MAG: hypothetical protein KAW92_10510 [Candidatus Cloacimonetes bacterium]|nr:hypothetical protein [Candidatus Cloacimonadota bacterium]
MNKVFKGKCKDCEFGSTTVDGNILCEFGGIREPESECNIIRTDLPNHDQKIVKAKTLGELSDKEFEKFTNFIKQEFGQEVVDRIGGEGWINVVIDLLRQSKQLNNPIILERKERLVSKEETGNWYEDVIEEPVRDLVRLLRDNGFNTVCIYGHGMYVQCQYIVDGEIQRLHNLLFNNGYRDYTINLCVQVMNGYQYTNLDIKIPKSEKVEKDSSKRKKNRMDSCI